MSPTKRGRTALLDTRRVSSYTFKCPSSLPSTYRWQLRRLTRACLALFALMLAGNVPRDDDVRLKDQDPALSGAWKHKVSHLADFKGERFFAKIGSSDPDEFIGIRVEGRRVRGMWRGSLWVNPGARPMQINFTGTDDDNHKVYRKGIYQVEGDDLTICL